MFQKFCFKSVKKVYMGLHGNKLPILYRIPQNQVNFEKIHEQFYKKRKQVNS